MQKVTEKLWIGPQPGAGDLERAKAAGIVSILNNRPDEEEPGQPTARQQAAEAAGLGLGYTHLPVVGGSIGEDHVRRLQQTLAAADGPVLAHCKSGMRSLVLWAIGEVLDGRMTLDDIDALGQRTGVNVAGARNWLAANR